MLSVGGVARGAAEADCAVAAEAERVDVGAEDARGRKVVLRTNDGAVARCEGEAVNARGNVADVLKPFEARKSARTRAIVPAAAQVSHAAALRLRLTTLRHCYSEQTYEENHVFIHFIFYPMLF